MSAKKAARRGSERRNTPRADARLSMRLEGAQDDGARAQVVTESQNISCSGVYCYSSHFLAPLSKVDLTIVLPQMPDRRARQELIKCEGIVVRCEPTQDGGPVRHFELACMFSSLDDEQRERIETFVTWRNIQALREAARGVTPRPAQRRSAATPAAKKPVRKPARKALH